MLNRESGFAIGFERAAAALEAVDDQRFIELAARGTLKVELFAPSGNDTQQPHSQDELYIVVAGRGRFVCGDSSVAFGPGDVLFAPARVAHRFEDFSDDLSVWVIFYGQEGGEAADGARLNELVAPID